MTTPSVTSDVILRAQDVCVSFGHVQALRGATISLRRGAITALVGDNGAGKSTLVKVLAGVQRPTSGALFLDGEPFHLSGPQDALRHGIEVVYQDLALAPDLSAAENLFLGRPLLRKGLLGRRFGAVDRRGMRRRAEEAFAKFGVTVQDADQPVRGLSGGQSQGIAVCRAATWASRLVILDEPTAALGVTQTQNVLRLMRDIRDQGTAVLLISHDLPQVLETADVVVILRQGRDVAELDPRRSDMREVVDYMTGARDPEADR